MVKLVFTSQYANLLALLLGVFILLFYYGLKKKKQRAVLLGNFETLQRVADTELLSAPHVILFLRLLMITLLIVGISSPVLVRERPSARSDYVVAIDTSASMFTDDIRPTRFAAAKDVASGFAGSLANASRIGVVSYAGTATAETDGLTSPPTAAAIIRDLGMGKTAGTAIGDAITTATTMLRESDRPRRIILVTDG
ncbi:MAG: VWA domain-containing protein [Candidatus Nanohaloarchaea archaeon]